MDTIYKKSYHLAVWLFAFLFVALSSNSIAQKAFDIDSDAAKTTAPGTLTKGATVKASILNMANFAKGDKFYFYYVDYFENENNLTKARKLYEFSFPDPAITTNTFSAKVDTVSDANGFKFVVGHFTGRFDYQTTFRVDDDAETHKFASNGVNYWINDMYFNQSGNRYFISKPFNLFGETVGDIRLTVNYSLVDFIPEDYGMVLEFSTNGTSWTVINTGSDSFIHSGTGSGTFTYTLPAGALTATTQFRLRQKNTVGVNTNEYEVYVGSINLFKGEQLTPIVVKVLPSGVAPFGQYIFNQAPTTNKTIAITEIANPVNGNIVNTTFPGYPGDQIRVKAKTTNMTLADYKFFIRHKGKNFLTTTVSKTDQANNEVELLVNIPVNTSDDWDQWSNLEVFAINKTEATVQTGVGPSVALVTAASTIKGGTRAGTQIDFTQSGERSFVSEVQNITSTLGTTLEFNLRRISEQIPPAEADILVEYSTNGTVWNLIRRIELGGEKGVGTTGELIVIADTNAVYKTIASATTRFRIRQANTTMGEDLHAWELKDVVFKNSGVINVIAQSLTSSFYTKIPSFQLAHGTPDGVDIYPGSNVPIKVINKLGNYPAGTLFQVYYGSTWLKTLTSIEDFSFVAPIDNGFQTLYVRAAHKAKVVQNTLNFTIEQASVEITKVSKSITDSGTDYVIAGSNLQVEYKLVGQVVTNLKSVMMLEIEAPKLGGGTEWKTIASLPITDAINTAKTGTISGTIPSGEYGPTPNIRLYIENNPWVTGDYTIVRNNNITSNYNPDGESRIHYYGNTYSAGYFQKGDKVGFTLYTNNDFEGKIEFVYYPVNDWGFQVFDSLIVTKKEGYYKQVNDISVYKELPEKFIELVNAGEWVYLGIRLKNDAAVLSNMSFRVVRERVAKTVIATQSINMIYPTISVEKLAANYQFAEAVNYKYSTFGFPASSALRFGFTMEQAGNKRYTFYETNKTGEVTLTGVKFPTADQLKAAGFTDDGSGNMDVNVKYYAFDNTTYPNLRLADVKTLAAPADFKTVEGTSWTGSLYFYKAGDRNAITNTFDLAAMSEPVKIKFDYSATITYATAFTLPYLEISTDDGKTYTTLVYDKSKYASIKRLPETSATGIEISIPKALLSKTTSFRWKQEAAMLNENTWSISNIQLISGSNEVAYDVKTIPASYNITLLADQYAKYNNFNTYKWELAVNPGTDLKPAVTVETNFDYNWKVALDKDNKATDIVWPDTTNYVFYVKVPIPNTADFKYVNIAKTKGVGKFTTLISKDSVPTGLYNVFVRAFIKDKDGKDVYVYPLAANAPAMTNTEILVVNETTEEYQNLVVEDLSKNFDGNTPEYNPQDTVIISYTAYGKWPTDIKFGAAMLQLDNWSNIVDTLVLETVASKSSVGKLAVKMPKTYEKNNATVKTQIQLFGYTGTAMVFDQTKYEYDLNKDFLEVYGHQENSSNPVNIDFDKDGIRYAYTKPMDLRNLKAGYTLNFDFKANNLLENQNTLVSLMFTADGKTFETVKWTSKNIPFGTLGFLPANVDSSFAFKLEAKHLVEKAQFMWKQATNQGAGNDVWTLKNVKLSSESNLFEDFEEKGLNPQDFNFMLPTIATDYTFSLITDANGFEPVVYSGDSLKFNWAQTKDNTGKVTGIAYPAGTKFDFYLKNYPNSGDLYKLTTTNVGSLYKAKLPADIKRDGYPIHVSASLDNFFYDKEANINKSLFVFNPMVEAIYNEANPVLFAGDSIRFGSKLSIAAGREAEMDNVFFNLILTHDANGDEILLDAKKGLKEEFKGALPTYINGNQSLRIEASYNAAMGKVGDILNIANDKTLVNGDFKEWYASPYSLSGNTGTRKVLTTLTDKIDMSKFSVLRFKILITEALAKLTEDQKTVLEYSLDGGVTYTKLASYPDARFTDKKYFENESLTDWFKEEIIIDSKATVKDAILRWRIEESKGTVTITDIMLKAQTTGYIPAPIKALAKDVSISRQRIDITNVSTTLSCSDAVVELSYNIRGVFGADNQLSILEYNTGYLNSDNKQLKFANITKGSGKVSFKFSEIDNSSSLERIDNLFRFRVEDKTNLDYQLNFSSAYNDVPVNLNFKVSTNTSLSSSNATSCTTEKRTIRINNVQSYFQYQLINAETRALVGDSVILDIANKEIQKSDKFPYYNIGNNSVDINIGAIDKNLTLELMVTALTKDGKVICAKQIVNTMVKLYTRPLYALYKYDANTNIYTKVNAGDKVELCESGNPNLAVGYENAGGGFSWAPSYKWYRDDLSKPITNISNVLFSGSYFAVVDDNACGTYETAKIAIEVANKPAQPQITVVGNAVLCEKDTARLTATSGYKYYRWIQDNNYYVGGNTATFNAIQTGSYQVQVSNIPFDKGCFSANSYPVAVNITNINNNASFAASTVELCSEGSAITEITVYGLQDGITYQLVNLATKKAFGKTFNSGTGEATIAVELFDGNEYGLTAFSDANPVCVKNLSARFTVVKTIRYDAMISIDNVWEKASKLTAYNSCGTTSLAVGTANAIGTGTYSVKWYNNGMYVNSFNPTTAKESGKYLAEITRSLTGNSAVCKYTTDTISINVGTIPVRPKLVAKGTLEFCEGEGELTLTAPKGFEKYRWTMNGNTIGNVASTDSILNVTITGDYRVFVSNSAGCGSLPSELVKAVVHVKPNVPSYTVLESELCEKTFAQVRINNPENNVMYQLFDVKTGLPSGDAEIGRPNLILSSANLTADVTFEVRASRLDVNTCASVSTVFVVKDANVVIEANGNTLVASSNVAISSYQWYRNDKMLTSNGNSKTLTIYDNAKYKVEVKSEAGCIMETSVGKSANAEIADETKEVTVGVYPNPAIESLTLKINGSKEETIKIRIIRTTGEVMFETSFATESEEAIHSIPVSNLTSGMYIIQVTGKDYTKTNQFIKL